MWHFAIPLFLMDLDTTSLSLSATYGLTLAAAVLIFGPVVGDWIDRKQRLFAVRVSLIVQNTACVLSAVLLLLNKAYDDQNWYDKDAWYVVVVKVGSIFLGGISQLGSTATGIIIQKDWIVVIASGDNDFMANLNSMVRRIDLGTKIIAPLVCGQIMFLFGLFGGAIFIVAWNLLSMCVEYFILTLVYKRTPALAIKASTSSTEAGDAVEMHALSSKTEGAEESTVSVVNGTGESSVAVVTKEKKKPKSTIEKMLSMFFTLKDGWHIYFNSPIALPCFGFSFLYMTVLGFGYVYVSYSYNQCLSEFMVAICTAGAAITGIIATFIFPVLRRKIGLIKTGMCSAFFQEATLVFCILSIFVAGSPYLDSSNEELPALSSSGNASLVSTNETVPDDLLFKCLDGVEPPSSFLSIGLLMAGTILARVGLWGFDLTITQLIQENVIEEERGIFNGVQSALNNLQDVLRFIFVLIFPSPSQFWILIFLSSAFLTIGYILFLVYVHKSRHSRSTDNVNLATADDVESDA